MITLAYPQIVQEIIDRWHSSLPFVARVDESQLTKEHLRFLIVMLIEAIDSEHRQRSTINDQPNPTTVLGHRSVSHSESQSQPQSP